MHGQADVIAARYDDSTRVRERLLTATVEGLGWKVQESQYDQHIALAEGERRTVTTIWSIDIYGKMSEKQVDGVRAMPGADSHAAHDGRMQNLGLQDWRASDGQAMDRGVVNLPPSIANIPNDVALSRHIRCSPVFDGA